MGRLHQENGGVFGVEVASGHKVDSSTLLYLPLSGSGATSDVSDQSGNEIAITNNGVTWQTGVQKSYGGASLFNGSNWLDIGSGSTGDSVIDWIYSTGSKVGTIEAWVYLRSTSVAPQVYQHRSIFGRGSTYINFSVTNNRNLRFYYWTGSLTYVDTTSQVSLNTWHHVAASFDGSQGRLFIDGVNGATWNFPGITSGGNSVSRYIGREGGGFSTSAWDGYIQDFRISNVARYTSNFTPAAPTVPIGGPSGVWQLGTTPLEYP